MCLDVSQITYAGAELPMGARITSRTIDSTINDVPMLSRPGSYAPVGLTLSQIVTVDLDVGGGDYSPSTGTQLVTMDDVNDELNRLYANLANGYNDLVIGTTPARFLICQKRKSEVTSSCSRNIPRSGLAQRISL